MKTLKKLGAYLLAIITAIFGFLALTKDSDDSELDERRQEIEDALQIIEGKEEELDDKLEEGFSEDEILEHWSNNDEE